MLAVRWQTLLLYVNGVYEYGAQTAMYDQFTLLEAMPDLCQPCSLIPSPALAV